MRKFVYKATRHGSSLFLHAKEFTLKYREGKITKAPEGTICYPAIQLLSKCFTKEVLK